MNAPSQWCNQTCTQYDLQSVSCQIRLIRFIKHAKQDTQGVAPRKSNGKLENNSKKNRADQLKSAFSEQSLLSLWQLSKQAMNDASPNMSQMDLFEFMEEGIRSLVSGLNPNKAVDPDKFKPWVLEEIADVLTPMVTSYIMPQKTT